MKKTFIVKLYNFLLVSIPLKVIRLIRRPPFQTNNTYIVIPADPMHPTGSMGDIAMLWGLYTGLRNKNPLAELVLIGNENTQIQLPNGANAKIIDSWVGVRGLLNFSKLSESCQGIILMGADVLDGKYSPNMVIRSVLYCEHAHLSGKSVTTLGFSFNNNPSPLVLGHLIKLSTFSTIRLRDKRSLHRFKSNVSTKAELTSDTAFLMLPDKQLFKATSDWVKKQRDNNRLIIGLNINRHALGPLINRLGKLDFISQLTKKIDQWIEHHDSSIILIPHDFKDEAGDIELLSELEKLSKFRNYDRLTISRYKDPAKIKFLTSKIDLIISGRMHLAIAALSQSTPVIAITYQSKFEGLYESLGQNENLIISPQNFLDEIDIRLENALTNIHIHRDALIRSLPNVLSLAETNIPK